MMPPVFVSVIEGHGEVEAFRVLMNVVVNALGAGVYPSITKPIRVPKGTLVNADRALEHYAAMAINAGGPAAKLFVLLDADDSCPAELGPQLLRRAVARFPHCPISVSVANREYESWFIASAASIARHTGTTTLTIPANIEDIRDAKGWVRRNLAAGQYKERIDQPAFSSRIDVPLARSRSQSFDRFCREVERLLAA